MRKFTPFAVLAAWALLLFPAGVLGQEQTTEHGSVDFGVRYSWGDVYGRPDLALDPCPACSPSDPLYSGQGHGSPFEPALKSSKYGEYRDLRDGLYIRRFDVKFENVRGTKNYVALQSQKSFYRDQSYLATFGRYGKFKIQFRYDEIPHTYSNTTRTLFTETAPGVWSFPTLIRQTLQATTSGNLPSVINTQVVPQFNFITPSIIRKAGTALLSYNLNANWDLNILFRRESEKGTRPIGLIMNSSPSASATGGYGVELPEPINYFFNTLRMGTEYGKRSWAVQAAYMGSFFQNNTSTLTWDNPFRLTGESAGNPLTGRMDLYPDNHANYLMFAGGTDLGKYLHLTGSLSPGWLRQNDFFLPYSTNTALTCGDAPQPCTSLAALPVPSLEGSKQTLAMNYTLTTTAWKNFELKAAYRHYDYNNNTPVHAFTPAQGDATQTARDPITNFPLTETENTPFGYNRKNLDVSGNWFFTKLSSFKIGYETEWLDRVHRDVGHTLENTFVTALDLSPNKDLLFRLSYRHANRKPDFYLDDVSEEISGGIPVDSPYARRFDEAARMRNSADGLLQYSPLDKLTLSAFGGTLQDDYNRSGGVNSATPLNFLTGAAATTSPYYLYGVLKDISYNYGFNADYAITPDVTLFAEYSRESYHKRMITRYRAPEQGATGASNGCGPDTALTANRGACDTANNDWESTSRERVDIWSAGVDTYVGKKAYITAYYSLSAARGNVFSSFLGDPINHPNLPLANDPDRFMLVGTNSATPYPETVNRNHEVVVILKYKLTKNLLPKIEYRYQQWDNKDYQTSPMTQYMGCVSAAGPPPGSVVGCTTPLLTSATSATPVGVVSPFYPGFVVGDNSSARFLFLGVDQPSYRAHYLTATLEYHF
ncbi:MAG: MtrB/PioB family outer membrane beta-barrel protein [Acidobacteriia bacterium]|nr:MtrB/PioB family outer membrane beta-barrel protein [Terriglobia bacterium]